MTGVRHCQSRHPTTAVTSRAGGAGDTVINGHRDILGAPFRHLDPVVSGDEITLYVGDVAYPHRVVEIVVVPEVPASASQQAENLELIGYIPEERLTLVTCMAVAPATHHLQVIAWPPEVPQMPEAGSASTPRALPVTDRHRHLPPGDRGRGVTDLLRGLFRAIIRDQLLTGLTRWGDPLRLTTE